MKSYIIGLVLLAFSSTLYAQKQDEILTKPVATTNVTNVVPEIATGVWQAFNPFGLQVTLLSGVYFESLNGFNSCGKYVDVTVAIPRSFPYNGSFYAKGAAYDPNANGVPLNTVMNLLPPGKAGVYGTLSIVSVDSQQLVINLNTPNGGPSGTFTLVRVPIVRNNLITIPPEQCAILQ